MRLALAVSALLVVSLLFVSQGMAATGTISGTLVNYDTNAPIVGYHVTAYLSKQSGGNNAMGQATTDNAGTFTLTIDEGTYYLQSAGADATNNYQWTYWDGSSGSTDYTTSAAVTVSSASPVTGVNMRLKPGGTLEVKFTDTNSVSITGVQLLVYPDAACNNSRNLPSYYSATDTVTAYGVPPGTVYMKPWISGSSNSYLLNWWNGSSGGSISCSGASGITITAGQKSGPYTFALAQGGKISGTVKNAGQTALSYINVAAYSGSPCGQTTQVAYASTDQNGEYSLIVPEGTSYYIRANDYNAKAYMQSWWDGATGTSSCVAATTVSATISQPVANVNFTMQTGGSIAGTVTNATGTGLSGVVVQAYDAAGYYLNQATTGSDGAYVLSGIPAGYALVFADGTANSNNYVRKWWDGGSGDISRYRGKGVLGDGSTTKTGVNFSLEAGGTLSGVITGPSGAALSGASIRVYATTPIGNYSSMTSTTTNSSGAFTLKGMPAQVFVQAYPATSGVNAVSTWWTGSAGGSVNNGDARPVAVSPGATVSDFNLQVAAGGTISGVVNDASGNPLSGKSVTVMILNDCGAVSVGSTSTASDGAFSVIGVPAGEAYVRASGGNYESVWWTASGGSTDFANAETVAVTAGQTRSGLSLALPSAGSISGTITDLSTGDPLYGVSVFAVATSCPTRNITKSVSTVTAVDGTYTLSGLAPGTQYVWTGSSLRRTDHAVTWHSSGAGASACQNAQGVAVTAGNTTTGVDVSLPHGGILSGVLTSPSGSARSCASIRATMGNACASGNFIVSTASDYNGSYSLYGLPVGSAYIGAAGASSQRLQDRYWNGTTGVGACSQAAAVAVTSGGAINDVDMVLPPAANTTPCMNLLMSGEN